MTAKNFSRVINIDWEHQLLHEGLLFQGTYGPIAQTNGTNQDFRIVTGAKAVHLKVEYETTGEGWLTLYDAPTLSGGTPIAVYNRDRESANTALCTLFHTPTTTAIGTLISGWISGSGNNAGSSRASSEWELAPNSTYLVRSAAKSANNICLRFQFYEE